VDVAVQFTAPRERSAVRARRIDASNPVFCTERARGRH
jgi:hypothetical protein